MNKATFTRFKNWIIATNPNLKLNESVSTNSIYLESDEIRIRISDHMSGLSKVKRFDISIVIPEESKQYIASVGFKVYIYDNLADLKHLLISTFRLCKGVPETTIKNAINCERGRLIHSQKEVQQQLTNSKNNLKKENKQLNKKLSELKVKVKDYGNIKTTVIKQNKTIKELKNKNKCLLEDINEATNLISELQANPDARKAIKISEKTYYFDNFPKDIQELLIESIQYYDKQY